MYGVSISVKFKLFMSSQKFSSQLYSLCLLLLIFALNSSKMDAQVTDLSFEHILSDKGLSQNTIHSVIQDREGFIWFATEDGLDKYDGYNFTVYKNDIHDKNSISDNFIWTIFEDKSGILWIGTNSGGLSKFNRNTEKFVNYKNIPGDSTSLSNNNVRTIVEDEDGILWIGTEGGGLNSFDKKTNKFVRYLHNKNNPKSINNNNVLSVMEDNKGVLWVGNDGGLDRFNKSTKTFTHFSYDRKNQNSISNNIILSIYEDKNDALWVGTVDGLNKFNTKTNKFKRFLTDPLNINNLSNSRINAILEDKFGTLWVGTGSGLYQFDRQAKQFISLKQVSEHVNTLIHNNILSLYEDNSGLIWIGTAEGGVVKFDRERMKFHHYKNNPTNNNSLNHNTVRAIYQDKNNILWIGTLGGGLNKFDVNKNKFTHFIHTQKDVSSLSDNSVTSILRDNGGTLWVGTWGGGLNKAVSQSDNLIKFVHYRHHPSESNSISSDIIQAIYQDSKGRIWVGTGVGLDLLDKKNGTFRNFMNDPNNPNSISNNLIQSCLKEDKQGRLWIGTWDGLNVLQIKNSSISDTNFKFISFKHNINDTASLSDNRVISIYEDKTGTLWFGTYGGGLNKLIVSDEVPGRIDAHFVHYSVKDGLASNIIYGILGDDQGYLWLSTDNGLSKFDPIKNTFRNYYASDGLQGNQFFWGASCKGTNGELFFGGTNGINAFFPSTLRDNTHVPPIVITNFQIFNQPAKAGDKNSPLEKSITETKSLEIPYNQNVFSFEYAALDFTAPNKNQYKYMMEGFDKSWIDAGNRRFVTYTNLDPGTYTFRVIGSNNDGIWNTSGASVQIRILPPFWRTWWFIIAAILVFGGIIASFITYRVKHLLDIERFRTKLAADLHDNIGSSLTEISILSEVISKKLDSADSQIKKSLKMISNNSRDLIDNMSDIVWLVNPKRDSLYDLILRLRDTYTELSSYTSISFRSENLKSLEKVSLSMEHRQHLYLIFKEGINNCITHSGCTEISLDAYVRGKRLEMILKDNGTGFKMNGNESGNGLENIQRRARTIGGVLNIDSKIGEGTTLQFIGNIL